MPRYHFISGLPRSGSTLLAAILPQNFIGEPLFEHDFENVEYDAPEFDFQLGVEGLHRVRPKVEFQARRTIIPPDLFEKYSQLSFWSDSSGSQAYVITAKPPEQGVSMPKLKS